MVSQSHKKKKKMTEKHNIYCILKVQNLKPQLHFKPKLNTLNF